MLNNLYYQNMQYFVCHLKSIHLETLSLLMFVFHQILIRENERHKTLFGQQHVLIGQLLKNELDCLKDRKQSFVERVEEGKDNAKQRQKVISFKRLETFFF